MSANNTCACRFTWINSNYYLSRGWINFIFAKFSIYFYDCLLIPFYGEYIKSFYTNITSIPPLPLPPPYSSHCAITLSTSLPGNQVYYSLNRQWSICYPASVIEISMKNEHVSIRIIITSIYDQPTINWSSTEHRSAIDWLSGMTVKYIRQRCWSTVPVVHMYGPSGLCQYHYSFNPLS